MTADTDSGWPLPSESERLRWLLSVAEGLMFGAGILGFVSFELAVITFITGSGALSVGVAAFGVIALLLTVRNVWFFRATSRSAPDTGPRVFRDPAYRDWWETRSWWLVGTLAFIVGAVGSAFAVLAFGFEPLGWALFATPALWAVGCIGFLVWSYAIYNVRGSLH